METESYCLKRSSGKVSTQRQEVAQNAKVVFFMIFLKNSDSGQAFMSCFLHHLIYTSMTEVLPPFPVQNF